MLTILVEAHEARVIGTVDLVAGAYLKANMVDFVIMKFTGASVDLLCSLNREHDAFVVMEGQSQGFLGAFRQGHVRLRQVSFSVVRPSQ